MVIKIGKSVVSIQRLGQSRNEIQEKITNSSCKIMIKI